MAGRAHLRVLEIKGDEDAVETGRLGLHLDRGDAACNLLPGRNGLHTPRSRERRGAPARSRSSEQRVVVGWAEGTRGNERGLRC
eukprot:5391812-Prymnesium_polylepis.1